MGLPMIFPSLLLMAVALVPVILVEAIFVKKLLKTNFKRLLVPVSVVFGAVRPLGFPRFELLRNP